MASTVKSQPNLYEVLGVEPTASDAEIARAFAREISPLRPRPLGGLARISLAYETLRDPARRRAYDASLAPAPAPEPKPSNWSMPRRDGWPFVASARIGSADLPAIHTLPRPASKAEPQPRPQAPGEAREAPFVAAPPAKPVTESPAAPSPQSEAPRPRQAPPKSPPPIQAAGDRPPHVPMELRLLDDAEDDSGEWKRPVAMGGALLLSVAVLGGWLGWESANDVEEGQTEKAVTFPVPRAKAASPGADSPAAAESALAVATNVAEQRAERTGPAAPAARADRVPPPRVAPAEEPQAEVAQAEETRPNRIEEIATALTAADEAPVAATPAKLPLPDSVVARTIGRIGYACGQVASTTPVEGAASGVFKVTCSSGDSYRAAPIRGRYHFRRWGR